MKKYETGRSMVEMLGVLAIIGVLSIAGISGYTIAIRRYRANEIVQAASILAMMAQAADAGDGDCITLSSSGLSQTIGGMSVDMVADATVTGATPTVSIKINDEGYVALCNTVEDIVDSKFDVECGNSNVSCS